MNLLRRKRETQFREPRLLESRTPGVAFEMRGSVRWKARRTQHPDIEALIRNTVVQRAQLIAREWYADDICGAQDAINTDLGAISKYSTPFYTRLTATVTLQLSGQSEADALKFRHSISHVERLHFLKEQLYSDPAMLLLDYLDRHPEEAAEPPDIARFQQLAMKVSNGERWWCRLLDALDKLSSNISDKDGSLFVMNMLIRTLKETAPDLIKQHQLEGYPFLDDNLGSGTSPEDWPLPT